MSEQLEKPNDQLQSRDEEAGRNSGDPDQEDDEILEESPCKRWSKRCEKVKQRDVPGIDASYLAMDNETGNEVVWNEVLFSERKNFRDQEEKIRAVFDHLTRLEHPNLVKFHKYWVDTKSNKPRIIFITEYMSSGSMSRFLQRARSSGTLLNIKAWKNWNRQILSALSYLHSCDPPIVHANLTCNTIFIQQNGLMATIGALLSGSLNGGSEKEKAVSGDSGTPSTAGGCGLHLVTEELIRKGIDSLEDPEQKEFIERCLEHDPNQRANVEELLNRLGLPEPEKQDETSLDEDGFLEDQQQADNVRLSHEPTPGVVLPERAVSSPPQEAAPNIEKTTTIQTSAATQKQAPAANIITNTKQDGYNSHFNTITPITTASTAIVSSTVSTSGTVVLTTTPASTTTTTTTNTLVSHPHSAQDEGYHTNQSIVESPGQVVDTLAPSEKAAVVQYQQHRETRQILQMHAEVFDQGGYQLRIQLQLDDQMNRQLTAPLKEGDTAETLTEELVKHGFISESNSSRMRELLETVQLVKRTNP